ncbi:MARVEL domain-containing protein 3 isoform X3 [Nycticebus coucang]|uniref:MARVEL domain-containing protein 3 isoform X3 n=1 Tax=Nycticebus coucang TaxID=9470 RepID=UPI00234D065D|nr:MARVEL domain-containing protein 3 isoform X3 [Nycticebus coucang]
MEGMSGTREPRARPRERDPDRRPHPDRDRHPERQRDRRRDSRRERNRDGRRDGSSREDRDRERDRDAREDRHRDTGHRTGERRAWVESPQSRTRDAPRGRTWDAAPPPWPAPGAAPEPPPLPREGLGRSRPKSEFTSGRYLPPYPEDVEYYESEAEGLLECHKCRYLCTGRACCQMLAALLNLLILACSSVSYSSTGGYTGITSLGGIYYYQFGGAYSGFSGADGEKAQELDVQFYQLKLPTVTAAMAYSGSLMAFCCLLVATGVLRVPWHCPLWLLVEGSLDVIIAGGYIPALYFYFSYLSTAYSSQEWCR